MMRFAPKVTARTAVLFALCVAGLVAATCFPSATKTSAAGAGGRASAAPNARRAAAGPAAYAAAASLALVTLDVDRTDDDATAIACTPAANDCSLRGAVITANVVPGTTINVPAGTYQLTIAGNGEQFAATGDLDIRASGTAIVGAGAATTIIQQTTNDRVLDVNPGTLVAGFTFNLSGVTIKGGNLPSGSGGGMLSGGSGAATTITNCIFDNNKTTGTLAANGGAITDSTTTGSTTLTVTNCTFSNNSTATGSGGAIRFNSPGTLTVTRSLFQNNKALTNAGGAINATFTSAAGIYNISQSAFVGNQANGGASRGGALLVGNGTANVSYSRFFGNTAGSGIGQAVAQAIGASGTVTVNNNWWGKNSAPSVPNEVFGSVVSSWLQLRLSAAASQLCPGATTGLTADIYGLNTGGSVPNCPGASCSLNGLPPFAATFSASNGTVAPTNTQLVDGAASATFTAGGTAGPASASVMADQQTVNTNLTVTNDTTTSDPADVSVCQGAMANFSTTASGAGPLHYAWTLDGAPFDGDSASIAVDTTSLTTGAHTVSVTVTGGCGAPATQTATLTVQPGTTATDPVDVTVCQGANAAFSTTASGSNLHYAWTLDGSPFNGDSASINVPTGSLSVGSHTVGLMVTGTCGTVSQSATLTVQANTSASDPADATVCQGAMASFSTTASGVDIHYAWTLDGSPFDGDSPSISVPTGSLSIGAHSVGLTVTGACGTASQTATLTVQENTSATDPADVTACQGAMASFSTTASGTNLHYAWTLDGSPFNGDSPAINVATGSLSTGSHTVGLTVTGTCGTVTHTADLTVQANTSATDPADVTVCQGAMANFSTTASGTDIHYAWTLDGSPFGTDSSSISVPTGSLSVGSHTVGLTVTGTCGTVSHTANLTVQANTVASDPADVTVCQGATAAFSTTASGTDLHYAWTLDGSPFGGDSPSINVPTGSLSVGTHSVGLTVTGTCGTVTQSATLTVQENTSASDPADVTVCQGATASFATTASGTDIHYAWTLDGSPFNGDSASINVPTGSLSVGTHTVGLTVTGTCGTVSQSATLTVQENTSTTDPADVAVCQGVMANFSTVASGTGPFHYAWTLDGVPYNGDSASITVNTTLLAPGMHTVMVTTTGTCGSAAQTATLTVGGPPTITLSQTTASMWPPNHRYRTFNVTDFVASASSDCDPNVDRNDVVIASVSSDELEENPSGADGNTLNDIVIAADCKSVQLRAERDANLNGRVYTITFRVRDAQGNIATQTVTVTVPVTQNGAGAVNSGPLYTKTSGCP